MEQLTNEEMTVISRYFAILPLLVNISEDVDLAYEINHLNNGMVNTSENFFNH